ncbi:acetylornithine deacetylase or succinyl-diaminopimelate desuccinylase [Thermovirga lienii DSM 17291]|jgi:succinyl-diaminopimelate desuccinylase|uniref:Acetylornithine deacetylase or succinyl-diaminopimelate desuccinylase n=1 Tax=Thermovirga lienii (strain ATCC BAA-1197 / DSM 17291 / Cas60314) TaxID=580340 RepID=G7V860_THELD|nr:M20 family metallo-hydrolase [Thermovirga lienii]AER67391.1 acetylornithine deacetylase or succinyl-diaminopimelate desuccinylase [Thermovirga lienii DSM 17291]HCD71453.1 diaminopimelate aminotransferase [Thermovirga lienii]
MERFENVYGEVENLKGAMLETLAEMIKIPAISPNYGYEGEYDKAEKLLEIIKDWPFDKIERYDAPDERAKNGVRPNILAYYYGKDHDESSRLWVLSHLDVVPPGDLEKWTITDPFTPLIKDDKIYGRGSEDNGQSIVSSLYAVKALMNLGLRPKKTVVLAFVSDEETGSEKGLKWLMENHSELFRKDDLVIVPDGGNVDGSFIEVAEKSILWLRIKVVGKQVHASMPQKGMNAHRIALNLAYKLDKAFHEKYNAKDELFEPAISTFEPTMASNPADSPNIVPGEHTFIFDCRVLPNYKIDDILADAHNIAEELKKEFQDENLPEIHFEVLQRLDAPIPTDPNSKIVQSLKEALINLRGTNPKIGGIGGGTFAAHFRKLGIPAVVWATLDEMAHQPNEYAKISNIVEDAKTIAYLAIN